MGGVSGGGSSGGSGGDGGARNQELPLSGKPCPGYTLIGSPENDAGKSFDAFIIDMNGEPVHSWTITGFPPRMLPGGSLIGCHGVFPSSYDCLYMEQRSWENELEWEFSGWTDLDGELVSRHHHDLQRQGSPVGYYSPHQTPLVSGRTLVLAMNQVTVPEIRDEEITEDVIYEVDEDGQLTDFLWRSTEHFDEFGFDDDAKYDIANREAGRLELLHGNAISRVGANRWFEAGHDEFHPQNIIYSSQKASFVAIISYETGNVVWRIGPDFAGRPEEKLGQFSGQHFAHIIPQGLPGAGNMLVFDNGGASGYGGTEEDVHARRYSRSYSRVLEFNPITFEVVWEYGAPSGDEFFYSPYVSSAQRLPNGNTLINAGVRGYVMEMTPDKEIVWDYQYESDKSGHGQWVYRAIRVPPEWIPASANESAGNYASWKSLFE